MSGYFNGTSTLITIATPSDMVTPAGAVTFVALARREADSAWASICGLHTSVSPGLNRAAMMVHSNNQLIWVDHAATNFPPTSQQEIPAAAHFSLLSSGKGSGSTVIAFANRPESTGTPDLDNGATSVGATVPLTTAGGKLYIGAVDGSGAGSGSLADFFQGWIEAIGVFASQPTFANLYTNESVVDWINAGAVGVWTSADQFATNLANPGTFDRTAIANYTDAPGVSSGWVLTTGAAPDPVPPPLVMAPPRPA